MANILGRAVAVWLIYALLALVFKHKIGLVIASILFVAVGIIQMSLFGDFLTLMSSILAIILIHFIVPLQIESEKKKQWKQSRHDKK